MQEMALLAVIKRIIMGQSHELMSKTSIPKTLWVEAFEYSVWYKNCAPTCVLKN